MAVAMAPGESRQVVRITPDHTYSLMEDALRDILLRDDVKDLPVVVVSIAGAFRTGKSFLLDFFLRYLLTPPTERESTAWLGGNNERLVGFTWRGGLDPETTGIHLWSEPIPVSLDSGEKVVVLLMDTQGAFDGNSTDRDCSTIFALSALISSVQIYNLSGNIKENDLQYLELFTQYGALARAEGASGKAFQELMFLVRDWQNPASCPYGATGGEQLLQKRLEINDQQSPEIRSVREQIRDTFENLSCFLMPYPGSCITDPNFSGSLSRLEEEFKMTLLELVPWIFKTCNLTPKMVNGEKVKAKELFEYIKTYMNTFNSGELPKPTTIYKAASELGLVLYARDAREEYEAQMQQHCGAGRPSVTPPALEALHRAALAAALHKFNNKKQLASREHCDTYLTPLTQELEDCLPGFVTSNNAKIRAAFTEAKEAYEAKLTEARGLKQLCLHPKDLEEFHKTNVDAILSEFDLTRRVMAGEVDTERIALVQHFGDRLEELRRTNEENNSAAVRMSREAYMTSMDRSFDNRSCVTADLLSRNHARIYNVAVNTFMDSRNRPSDHTVDHYKDELINRINSDYNKLKLTNESRSCALVLMVMNTYDNSMKAVSGMNCLHPNKLVQDHIDAKAQALKAFNADQLTEQDDDHDDDNEFLIKLLKELEERYQKLCTLNEANNNGAVEAALTIYCRKMDENCRFSPESLLVFPLIIKIACKLPKYHKKFTEEALDVFWKRRQSKGQFDEDIYLEKLYEKLNDGFLVYCAPVQAAAREFGVTLPPPFSNDPSNLLPA